jgi:hypothetical protein
MPSWKKILQSGSAIDVLNITASGLPNSLQPNIIGYDTASGRFTYFSTSSIAGGTSGTGTENYITRWSSGTTITTSSIYESSSRIGIGTTSPQGTLHIRGVSDNGVTPGIFLDSNGFDNNEPFDIRLASAGVGAAQARGIRIIASSSLSNFAGGAAISFYNITSSAFPGWVLIDSGAHNSAKILFRTAATNGAISTGERMVISSSGNVGIGTSTPTTTLNVNGTTLLQGGQTTVRGDTATSAATALRVENNNSTSLLTILNDGTSAFNTSHLYVSSSGLVGIGTTTPGVNLDVSGDIRASSGMFNSTTQTQTIRINSTTHLAFQNTGSVEVARFNNAGNWGIGTTSPTERLHVDGNMIVTGRITAEEFHTEFVSASIIYQSGSTQFGNSSDDTHIFTGSLRVNGSITGSLFGTASVAVNAQTASFLSGAFLQNGNSFGATAILGTNDTQNLQFETSGSVRMTISSSGNIGIGTTTPQFKLHVLGTAGGDATFNGGILVENNNATDGEAALAFRVNSMAAASNYWFTGINQSNNYDIAYGTSFTNANTALSISSSRNIGIGTISPSAQLHISGSATTPLRIQNPATTLMQISSSAANSGSVVLFGTTPTSGFDLDIQGTGTANGGSVRIAGNSTIYAFSSAGTITRTGTGNTEMFGMTMGGSSTSAIQNPLRVEFNANQNATSGSGYIVLRLNATHASTAGTGSKLLQTWEFGGVRQSVMDISGSLGIGTGSAPPARLFISGANNQSLLQVSSPSNANILFVTGSGRVGVGTTTPTTTLDVVGNIKASSGIEGLLFATNNYVSSDSVFTNLVRGYQSASFGVPGIDFPTTAIVHISGANNQNLLRVSSPTNQNILFVNGNGIVGINTTSSMALLSGSGGGFVSGEGNIIPTLTIFQSSSSTGLNSAGLQIVGSGSSPFAAARLNILTMGDKYAYLNIGTSGSGTQNNYWEFAKRPSSINHRLVLSNYSNGVHNGTFMNLAPGADTSYIGAQSQISLEGNTGNIGIQTSAGTGTQEYIHLYSVPVKGKYIRIDAAQSSNDPPLRNTGNDYTNIYGPGTDTTPILGEPDYWMEIKLDGTVVLIPCYLPA